MAVLSIQSQVVRGHVGNSVSVFALERLGHVVWPLPTVLYSNHPGHGSHYGHVVDTGEVQGLLDGLAEHEDWLKRVDAIHTGFIGDDAQIDPILSIIEVVKEANPNAIYVCDPVVGDHGRTYVDDNIREGLMEDLIPQADIVMPNVFELQSLLEQPDPIENVNQAVEAARLLPCETAIVTSVEDPGRIPGQMATVLVKPSEAHMVVTKKIDFEPSGAGDLLAAITLGDLLKRKPIEQALAHAAGSLFDILQATHSSGADELLIIQQQERIVSPFTTVAVSRV